MYRIRTILVFLFIVLIYNEVKAQKVSPIQSGRYSTTFINVRDMAKASPGFFALVYNYYAFSDTYVDSSGKKYKELELDGTTISDMSLNTYVMAPALFWAAKKEVLGATYMFGLVPSYMNANATFLPAKGSDLTAVSSKLSGFSDLFVSPVTLSWGLDNFDLTFSYGFTAPTAKFNVEAEDNLGMGFWSNQFQAFGYYYTSPEQTTALMLALTYEINGKTKGVDVSPGNRLALEWGASTYVSERVELGIQGGSIWQVSDDKGDDVYWNPSVHDKISTIGFMAGYWAWKNRMQLVFKYNHDFVVRQGFRNDAFMLNVVFITNLLTGSKKTAKQQ